MEFGTFLSLYSFVFLSVLKLLYKLIFLTSFFKTSVLYLFMKAGAAINEKRDCCGKAQKNYQGIRNK